jgi:hypothetical protein
MSDLTTKIRTAAAWDREKFDSEVTYNSEGFVNGARYQHAQNAWAFEALEIAVDALDWHVKHNGASTVALDKIAALVPGGES